MSSSYASRLQYNHRKGLCGDAERRDTDIHASVTKIVELIRHSKHCIVHTGAGISTSCGIPDFRGPSGVWTREAQGLPPPQGVSFDDAIPSISHTVINRLFEAGLVKHVVTQNVDGLHIKAGLPRTAVSEIHGTVYAEYCDECNVEYRTRVEVQSMGLKLTGSVCPECGAALRDMICDWDSPLPEKDLAEAEAQHKMADLVLVLGTSLRIRPAGNFPMKTRRRNGKPRQGDVVIVNLQTTHLDREASVRVFQECDVVMQKIANVLL